MQGRFVERTVLITGAAGGFGRSLAALFAAEGAHLILSDVDADGLEEVARTHGAGSVAGSVTEEAHCREAVELALDLHGRLDVAINNAGIAHAPAAVTEIDAGEARRCLEVSVMGVFLGMKHQLRAMVREAPQGVDPAPPGAAVEPPARSILNMASLAGIGGAPGLGVYAAAKHAVVGLTRTAALENARHGIRVNCLCPSFARTRMVDGLLGSEGRAVAEARLVRGIPMRRIAEVEEVTRQALWLCDPANGFMTGQAIAVDGGTSAA